VKILPGVSSVDSGILLEMIVLESRSRTWPKGLAADLDSDIRHYNCDIDPAFLLYAGY
jgi:hypothetical protein